MSATPSAQELSAAQEWLDDHLLTWQPGKWENRP